VAAGVGDRLLVGLVGAPGAGGERDHLEPGVAVERDEELLAGDAGRAHDGDTSAGIVAHGGGTPPIGEIANLPGAIHRRNVSARPSGWPPRSSRGRGTSGSRRRRWRWI
jgi:hypothetical protein